MEKLIRRLIGLAILPLILSCNIYAPLTSNSSQEDHLEEARKCLHDGNFTCAVENYEKLPDGDLKKQKLCTVHLSKMGFTLSNLINTVTEKTDKVLGNLANNLGTWTADRYASAEAAKTQCSDFAATANAGDLGVLLKTISLFAHCANLISKVDIIVGVDDTIGNECTTAGAGDGKVVQGDISVSAGTASSGSPGMCAADVEACRADIFAIDPDKLAGSSFNDIKDAWEQVPAELRQGSAAVSALRQALRSVISAN